METINKYVEAKFKLLKNQHKGNLAFIKKNDNIKKKKNLENIILKL